MFSPSVADEWQICTVYTTVGPADESSHLKHDGRKPSGFLATCVRLSVPARNAQSLLSLLVHRQGGALTTRVQYILHLLTIGYKATAKQ